MAGDKKADVTFNDQAFVQYLEEQAHRCRPIPEVIADKLGKHRGFIASMRERGVSWDSILEGVKRGGLTVTRAQLIAAWGLLEAKGEKKAGRKSKTGGACAVAGPMVGEGVYQSIKQRQAELKAKAVVALGSNNAAGSDVEIDAAVASELESALKGS